MKKLLLITNLSILFLAILSPFKGNAQSVGINKDGSAPDASAMLDVKNPNKGLLVPRVTLTGTDDVATIPTPATSLLVYNTVSTTGSTAVNPGFYYWNGTVWVILNTGSATASWLQTGNAGTDAATQFIGTTDNTSLNFRVNNQKAGSIDAILSNTYWGYQAGNNNNGGGSNTGIGKFALQYNANGDLNSALGYLALGSNTDGYSNTAVGYRALNTNTIGFNNTALGYNANVSTNNLYNATAIGNGAIVTASNSVQIGNSAVTVVRFGSNTFGAPNLYAGAYLTVSDARFKYNVQNNVPGLEFIKRITPVTYYIDGEKLEEFTKTGVLQQRQDDIAKYASYSGAKQLHTGFLAQDVEKIANELGYVFDGVRLPANDKDHYSISYSQFVMPLVKAVQEQQQIIETQKTDIDLLKAQVAELTKAVKTLTHK